MCCLAVLYLVCLVRKFQTRFKNYVTLGGLQQFVDHRHYLREPEDFRYLAQRKGEYETYIKINVTHLDTARHVLMKSYLKNSNMSARIIPEENYLLPDNLHFIWIGSKIPRKYVNNIQTYRDKNKKYDIYLWLDNHTRIETLNVPAGTQIQGFSI